MKNKNRGKSVIEQTDLVFEDELHGLADAISEKTQTTTAVADPFEEYIEVVRTKVHSNPHIFRSRLAKGYNALLYQLQEGENASDSSSQG